MSLMGCDIALLFYTCCVQERWSAESPLPGKVIDIKIHVMLWQLFFISFFFNLGLSCTLSVVLRRAVTETMGVPGLCLILLLGLFEFCAVVYCYTRPPPRQTIFVPESSDADSAISPQQVTNKPLSSWVMIIWYLIHICVFSNDLSFCLTYHTHYHGILLLIFKIIWLLLWLYVS